MVTKAQETAAANVSAELKKLQEDFYIDWVSGSLPKVWNDIPILHPVKPDKTKITLTLDADMVAWFRKLGRGYQARVNSILRIYWQALLAGHVKSHWDAQAVAPRENTLLEGLLTKKIKEVQKNGIDGLSKAELTEVVDGLQDSLQLLRNVHGPARPQDL